MLQIACQQQLERWVQGFPTCEFYVFDAPCRQPPVWHGGALGYWHQSQFRICGDGGHGSVAAQLARWRSTDALRCTRPWPLAHCKLFLSGLWWQDLVHHFMRRLAKAECKALLLRHNGSGECAQVCLPATLSHVTVLSVKWVLQPGGVYTACLALQCVGGRCTHVSTSPGQVVKHAIGPGFCGLLATCDGKSTLFPSCTNNKTAVQAPRLPLHSYWRHGELCASREMEHVAEIVSFFTRIGPHSHLNHQQGIMLYRAGYVSIADWLALTPPRLHSIRGVSRKLQYDHGPYEEPQIMHASGCFAAEGLLQLALVHEGLVTPSKHHRVCQAKFDNFCERHGLGARVAMRRSHSESAIVCQDARTKRKKKRGQPFFPGSQPIPIPPPTPLAQDMQGLPL